jgi:hypothetical protein
MTARLYLVPLIAVACVRQLEAQTSPAAICQLPYRTMPSPGQVAAMFHNKGLDDGSATTADSLVELTDSSALASITMDLPKPDTAATVTVYRYGSMVARLLRSEHESDCSLTLYGPPPFRPIQMTLTVNAAD